MRIGVIALLSLFCSVCAAQNTGGARCTWEGVALKYSVNQFMLYSIAKTESNLNPSVFGRNTNGSYDIGLMQINSSWLPKLRQFGIFEAHLLDPCVSLEVGAWILRDNMARLGNSWDAVGAYNAKSKDKRIAYAKKVLKNLPPQAYLAENGYR